MPDETLDIETMTEAQVRAEARHPKNILAAIYHSLQDHGTRLRHMEKVHYEQQMREEESQYQMEAWKERLEARLKKVEKRPAVIQPVP